MLHLKIDQEKCVTCGECISDCPVMVLKFGGDGYPMVRKGKEVTCLQCQHCLAICPTGALSICGKDPDQSLPLDNLPDEGQMERLIKGRRSVRRYKPEPVDAAVISKLMAVISNAPTGKNNLQMMYTVVEDAAVMDKVREATYGALRKAVDSDSVPPGLELFKQFVELWENKRVDVLFRGAPHLLVASSPNGGPSPEADCIIGLSYFELLARSMGLGTLWDGLAKWAMTLVCPELLRKMGVPDDHTIGYMMIFGKPAMKYHRTVQRDGMAVINRVEL